MTSVIQKERELSEYLLEWVNTYYRKWNPFYYETRQNKDAMRAQLLHANRLLGLLNSIIGNLEVILR